MSTQERAVKKPPYEPGTPKIPPVRFPSGDCAIMHGMVIKDGEVVHPGTPIKVHEGEWVDLVSVRTLRETLAVQQLTDAWSGVPTSATPEGEDEKAARARLDEINEASSQMRIAFEAVCEELARRTISWNWTDMQGYPLEQPFNRPDVIQSLASEEVLYLMSLVQSAETETDRGNASTPSPDSSSTARA